MTLVFELDNIPIPLANRFEKIAANQFGTDDFFIYIKAKMEACFKIIDEHNNKGKLLKLISESSHESGYLISLFEDFPVANPRKARFWKQFFMQNYNASSKTKGAYPFRRILLNQMIYITNQIPYNFEYVIESKKYEFETGHDLHIDSLWTKIKRNSSDIVNAITTWDKFLGKQDEVKSYL